VWCGTTGHQHSIVNATRNARAHAGCRQVWQRADLHPCCQAQAAGARGELQPTRRVPAHRCAIFACFVSVFFVCAELLLWRINSSAHGQQTRHTFVISSQNKITPNITLDIAPNNNRRGEGGLAAAAARGAPRVCAAGIPLPAPRAALRGVHQGALRAMPGPVPLPTVRRGGGGGGM
jgi:hypothetical protein